MIVDVSTSQRRIVSFVHLHMCVLNLISYICVMYIVYTVSTVMVMWSSGKVAPTAVINHAHSSIYGVKHGQDVTDD